MSYCALETHLGSAINALVTTIHNACNRVYTTKRLVRLRAKIAQSVEENGVEVDVTSHSDVNGVRLCLHILQALLLTSSGSNSFKLRCTAKANQRRWHPLMIKWTLYLRHLSGKAYDTIRDTGCIALPSQHTLRDYTHFIESSTGFSADVDKYLMEVT